MSYPIIYYYYLKELHANYQNVHAAGWPIFCDELFYLRYSHYTIFLLNTAFVNFSFF